MSNLATLKKETSITQQDFRTSMGQFATGVTVVSTKDQQGAPYGMTASSFGSISLDPPLVQWSITTKSFSYPIFSAASTFAINILSTDQQNISDIFTKPIDRFENVSWEIGMEGLPLIHGCLSWIECSVENQIVCGDHTIFIGRVRRARYFEKKPLLFWRGGYEAVQ
ncbi:MAG: flavin reductase family protein [Kordiimonadaceae bacterium]|nr:flavin reductase family protein [Kordiimonadaceae bacterium]